jgi:hypothetical protein
VATENRIRDGADAAMRYPRFGMLDLLKLLSGLLVGLLRSHTAREAETAFLRHQLVVLKRSAPTRLRLRTADRLIFVWLYRLCPSVREAAVVFKPETIPAQRATRTQLIASPVAFDTPGFSISILGKGQG